MRERATAKARVREIAVEEVRKPSPHADDLQRWISEAAYYRAESRGFQPGRETDDWLAAEAEVMARTRGARGIL